MCVCLRVSVWSPVRSLGHETISHYIAKVFQNSGWESVLGVAMSRHEGKLGAGDAVTPRHLEHSTARIRDAWKAGRQSVG